MNDLVDLERFVGQDLGAAEEAFMRMSPQIERFLKRYLTQLLPRAEDREDVVAQTLVKLWQSRTSFRVQGVAPWWSYVAKTGRRCGLTKLGEAELTSSLEDVRQEDSLSVELLAQYSHDRRRLYEAADQLWLCIDSKLEAGERRRRLLAAQMVFLHGISPKDVPGYLGRNRCTREELDSWLVSESTLLDLSYHSLFSENSTLTKHFLGIGPNSEHPDLAWWISQVERRPEGTAPNGMSWDEVAVIVWRHQFGMITEKILQRAPDLKPELVERVLSETESRMPCVEAVNKLAKGFSASWVRSNPLTNPNLWKRLVFQYCVHSALPQKQILQCTQPAAEIVGHKITSGMLNVWLSNGRLFAQLAGHAQEARI